MADVPEFLPSDTLEKLAEYLRQNNKEVTLNGTGKTRLSMEFKELGKKRDEPKSLLFNELEDLANHLRGNNKKVTLIFAHNGIGKTRLSMEFKELGKQYDGEGQVTARDTLYFNAFTEDLFRWDNDLKTDRKRFLKMNKDSAFFSAFFKGFTERDMENRIRPILHRYCDFDFEIDYDKEGQIHFWRKISRGEENLFIWCFFLAVAQLAIDGEEAYDWVKYLYIDDPISSLDENNAISVAVHLAQLLKGQDKLQAVVSSHHPLFFNVLCNELKKSQKYFLGRDPVSGWRLHGSRDTLRFYHVTMLMELRDAERSGKLYTYHFNILRSIMEKTAIFHGFSQFSCIMKRDKDDKKGDRHARYVNILSHGDYSLFEPVEMDEENKEIFRKILDNFMGNCHFNPELFSKAKAEETAA